MVRGGTLYTCITGLMWYTGNYIAGIIHCIIYEKCVNIVCHSDRDRHYRTTYYYRRSRELNRRSTHHISEIRAVASKFGNSAKWNWIEGNLCYPVLLWYTIQQKRIPDSPRPTRASFCKAVWAISSCCWNNLASDFQLRFKGRSP